MHLLPTLAAVVLAPIASAQFEVLSSVDFDTPFLFVDPTFAVPHPDGGTVLGYTKTGNPIGPATLVLSRVSDDGQLLWTRDDPILQRIGRLDSLRITPSGVTVVNVQASAFLYEEEGEILAIDGAGNLLWSAWPAPALGTTFVGRVAGFSPSGDLYVFGHTDGDDTVSALLIDVDTGAEIWRVDLTGADPAFDLPTLQVGVGTTDLFAVWRGATSLVVARIDPTGQVLYQRSLPVTSVTYPEVQPLIATPDGGLYVAVSGPEDQVVRLDALGSIVWQDSVSGFQGFTGIDLAEDGGVIATYRRLGGRIRRLDPDGNQLWIRSGPAGTRRFAQVRAAEDGSFWASYTLGSASGPTGGGVVRYLANGGPGGDVVLPSTSSDAATFVDEVTLGAFDARGHAAVLHTSSVPNPGAMFPNPSILPREIALVRIALDELTETVECAQSTPNSTGSLGLLRAIGSPVADRDSVALVADRLPPGQTVLFLNARQGGFTPNPGGSAGDLCLGAPLTRYLGDVTTSGAGGRAVLQLDLAETPDGAGLVPVVAGETWFWQAWHREPGSGSHLTSAVSVVFE